MRHRTTSTARTARRRLTALSYMGSRVRLPAWPAIAIVAVGAVDCLELLERASGSDRDARQRRLGAVRGHLRLLAQPLVQALEQRAAAGEHDAAVHDVRGQLRGR